MTAAAYCPSRSNPYDDVDPESEMVAEWLDSTLAPLFDEQADEDGAVGIDAAVDVVLRWLGSDPYLYPITVARANQERLAAIAKRRAEGGGR